MDRNPWVSTLAILLLFTHYLSGQEIPGNVTVHIWEGNVTVTWDPPQENPGNYLYQVQLLKYGEPGAAWENVSDCNLITSTICNIGNLAIHSNFRVQVGVLMNQTTMLWSRRRQINTRRSQLFAPTFTLSSTPYSVQVKIHRKQILYQLFPYDVKYTTYLWPQGQENQTLTKSDEIEDDGEVTFNSLKFLQEYCVRVMVETTTTDANNVSSTHCTKLPLDVTMVIYFISLGLLVIVAFPIISTYLLRRPQKMPSALKLEGAWEPMVIKSDKVESVTDKAWIVFTNNTYTKKVIEFTEKDDERRGSLDSGVSIERLSLSACNEKTDGQIEDAQVDSGCESLKGSELDGSVMRERQLSNHEIHNSGKNERTDDSGLGLGHHEASGSLELEDTGLLSEVVVGDGYRSQSPSSVDVQNDMESDMAAPSAGYRSGHVKCMCSDHEYCIWCKFKNPFTGDCQPVTQSQTDFRHIDDGNSVSSSYLKKSCMQSENLLNMGLSVIDPVLSDNNYGESSTSLMSCPLLLQNENRQDSTTHTRTFTLDNMELTFS